MTIYRAAAVQFEPVPMRPDLNVPRLLSLVEEAADHGARLVVLPEMATSGYCFADREEVAPFLEPVPGPFTRRLERVAAARGCVVVSGLGEIEPESGVFFNTAVVIGPDGYLGKYRKTHFFSADATWAVEGDLGLPVWDTPAGRLGVAICMDATYPEVGRVLALAGAEVICFPTNWVGSITPDHRWISSACENGVYWIAANRYGEERGLEFRGGSGVVAPDGRLAALAAPGEGIVYAQIDLETARGRRFSASRPERKLADRRPDLYHAMLQTPYTWSAAYYHSLFGAPGLPPARASHLAVVQVPAAERYSPSLAASVRAALPPAPVDLIVLPELLFTPPDPASIEGAEGLQGIDALRALAAERRCLVAGTVVERAGDAAYLTAVLADGNRVLGTQRACHLKSTDRGWATAADGPYRTIDTPLGRIGLVPGYDASFFETLRVLANAGADLVCVPADLPWPLSHGDAGPDNRWQYWKSKAWESCIAVAVANYAPAGSPGDCGIWVPDVREDRSRASTIERAGYASASGTLDTGSRYIREKRGLGWRRLQWYKSLVSSSDSDRSETALTGAADRTYPA